MTEIQAYIKRLKEHGIINADSPLNEEEGGGVGNVTSNVDGYNTPGAFDPDSEDGHESNISQTAEVLGYYYPKKTRKFFESSYTTMAKQLCGLNEGTYKDFKRDNSQSSQQKINAKVKEINRMIYEVERMVDHANKLKQESNLNQGHYWKKSKSQLVRIAERVIRLSKKITDLGA